MLLAGFFFARLTARVGSGLPGTSSYAALPSLAMDDDTASGRAEGSGLLGL
jgi:hypothetical protein